MNGGQNRSYNQPQDYPKERISIEVDKYINDAKNKQFSTPEELIQKLKKSRLITQTMLRNLYSIVYDFSKSRDASPKARKMATARMIYLVMKNVKESGGSKNQKFAKESGANKEQDVAKSFCDIIKGIMELDKDVAKDYFEALVCYGKSYL